MSYKTWIAVAAAFFLGIGYMRIVVPKPLPEGDKTTSCRGEAQGRLDAIETFCTLLQDQLTPEACLQTDYVKALGLKTGTKWIGECAGTWIGNDSRPSVPTTSTDFYRYRNVDPLGHQ